MLAQGREPYVKGPTTLKVEEPRCRPESLSPAQVSSLRYYHGVSLARPRRLCSSDARRRRTLATISSPGAPRASGRR